jgi:hypothetical protein
MAEEDKNPEKYIGYAKLLDLPSGRIGLQVTVNNIKALYDELMTKEDETDKIHILVLPVKPHNVTDWRSHSVKISKDKYTKDKLINDH